MFHNSIFVRFLYKENITAHNDAIDQDDSKIYRVLEEANYQNY